MELMFPVAELRMEDIALEPITLPDSEVSILNREIRERRSVTGGKCSVKRIEFVMKDPGRPAVGDDMVHGKEKDEIGVGQAEQRSAEERAASEIKRQEGLVGGDLSSPGITVGIGEGREVVKRERNRQRRSDDLDGMAVTGGECSPEDFVTVNYFGQAPA